MLRKVVQAKGIKRRSSDEIDHGVSTPTASIELVGHEAYEAALLIFSLDLAAMSGFFGAPPGKPLANNWGDNQTQQATNKLDEFDDLCDRSHDDPEGEVSTSPIVVRAFNILTST